MNSPLEISSYFFPLVSVTADPHYNPDKAQTEPEYKIRSSVEHDEKNGLYQVAVEITLEPESEDKRLPYSIKMIGIGLFRVATDWPEPEKLLAINGASIIYSAAREFLITITSRGPWGQIFLPAHSFIYNDAEKTSENIKPEKSVPKKTKK